MRVVAQPSRGLASLSVALTDGGSRLLMGKDTPADRCVCY